jgi:TRAP-type C4-dicarboxylate transport system permease small subunit
MKASTERLIRFDILIRRLPVFVAAALALYIGALFVFAFLFRMLVWLGF